MFVDVAFLLSPKRARGGRSSFYGYTTCISRGAPYPPMRPTSACTSPLGNATPGGTTRTSKRDATVGRLVREKGGRHACPTKTPGEGQGPAGLAASSRETGDSWKKSTE